MAAAVEDPEVEVVATGEPAEGAVERQIVAARAGEVRAVGIGHVQWRAQRREAAQGTAVVDCSGCRRTAPWRPMTHADAGAAAAYCTTAMTIPSGGRRAIIFCGGSEHAPAARTRSVH
jgi:hypothetical protein